MSGGNNISSLITTTVIPNVTEADKGSFNFDDSFDFKNNPGLVFLLVVCVFTGIWLLFLTFYNSRLFAFVITRLIRKLFLKDGHLEIGMF